MKKKILRIILIAVITLFIIGVSIAGFAYFGLRGIPESHIEGNVPDESVFNQYFLRDLTTYFKQKVGKEVSVRYELLRDGPSQSGLAYPKYYAWVTVVSLSDNSVIQLGAVYIAAINKEYFQVDDFISKKEIEENPDTLNQIFPLDVIVKIKQKIN